MPWRKPKVKFPPTSYHNINYYFKPPLTTKKPLTFSNPLKFDNKIIVKLPKKKPIQINRNSNNVNHNNAHQSQQSVS